ncbi:MAG: respiratory nitrate reductase subunit gamma, partial [Candidatus Aminicenantes bacterium]
MIKTFDIFFILVALVVFIVGLNRRFRLWRVGKNVEPSGSMGARIRSFLWEGIAHRRILQEFYPGLLHLFLFLGFLVPLIVVMITQFMFTLPPSIARPLSLVLDLFALAALTSVILFIYRRYITRPPRLDNRTDDLSALVLIFLILLTGILLESLRVSVIGKDATVWAPVGRSLAALINTFGLSTSAKGVMAMIVFRIHFFLVLTTFAAIPYSRLFHIISSPMNMLFRPLEPKGILSHLDLEDEEAESFGVSKIEEFTWKQLMDLD